MWYYNLSTRSARGRVAISTKNGRIDASDRTRARRGRGGSIPGLGREVRSTAGAFSQVSVLGSGLAGVIVWGTVSSVGGESGSVVMFDSISL